MNPELLKTFLAVCKHLNFTRAAHDRLLTQPAVSRQVRQLEEHLGVPLFERLGKSIQLTDAGRALAPQASQLLGQMERISEAIRGFHGAHQGRLRIGASTTPGFYVLPPILGVFHRDYPDVELDYVIDNTLSIEQRILRNELDVAFVGAHLVGAALNIEPVLEDRIVCFCAPSHPLCSRRRVSPGMFGDVIWVIRERGSATRQLFEQRLESVGAQIGRRIELSSPEGIKALVGAGLGASFMSEYGLRSEFEDGSLRPLDIKQLQISRPIYVVRHADKHESPVMREFVRRVQESRSARSR